MNTDVLKEEYPEAYEFYDFIITTYAEHLFKNGARELGLEKTKESVEGLLERGQLSIVQTYEDGNEDGDEEGKFYFYFITENGQKVSPIIAIQTEL